MENKYIEEAEALTSTTMLDQLKKADHFYIVHYFWITSERSKQNGAIYCKIQSNCNR